METNCREHFDPESAFLSQPQFRSFGELPEKYRTVFSSYPCLNAVQTQVVDHVLYSNNSIVVSAPTGSGKTVIFELAIIKLLMQRELKSQDRDFKIVYIAPVKALCTERCNDWGSKFAQFGLSCVEITGDTGDYFDLQGYHLILTTPEKWDSLTRKWRDNMSLVQLVKLFLVDEVHLLSDEKRGPVLETVVCRMKTVAATLRYLKYESDLRFIAVSATIYNIEDLATWLGKDGQPANYYKFGNEMRPVKLNKIVKGYTCAENQNSYMFDVQLTYKLKALLLEYAQGKPSLIFCSTRKSVVHTSQILSQQITFHFSESQLERLQQSAYGIVENKLKNLVLSGIGCHHAGMTVNDRHIIQDLFASSSLPVLVATSTLAMGVNLPAHLVIIKSTQQFISGKVIEYPESSILQMIGRAGRPQFDAFATAIIMTKSNMVSKYERMLDSKEVVESNLHKNLTEYLNSEIVLFTITDISVAMEWIHSTFLYVRALKNPKYYGFDISAKVETKLQELCLREINGLKRHGLVEFSPNGIDIFPTVNGKLMSHFYLSFETFKIFLKMKGTETIPEILVALSEAHEFNEVQLRVNEKVTLNGLNHNKNRSCIRYPLPSRIKHKSMKVNCLIQACLGCLPIQDPALLQESIRIVKAAERITKCLSEFLSTKNFYQALLNSKILAKCLHAKLWEDSPFISRQLERIGPSLGSLLSACGKTTFQAIEESNPRDLERILNRAPPLGNILQDAVYHLPKYNLKIFVSGEDFDIVKIDIAVRLLNINILEERNTAGDHHWLSLIIGDTDNNLLAYRRLSDQNLMRDKTYEVSITLKVSNLPASVFASLISEQWIGLDVKTKIDLLPQTVTLQNTNVSNKAKKTSRKSKSESAIPTKKIKTNCNGDKSFNCIVDFLSQYSYSKNQNKTDGEKMRECLAKTLTKNCLEDTVRICGKENFNVQSHIQSNEERTAGCIKNVLQAEEHLRNFKQMESISANANKNCKFFQKSKYFGNVDKLSEEVNQQDKVSSIKKVLKPMNQEISQQYRNFSVTVNENLSLQNSVILNNQNKTEMYNIPKHIYGLNLKSSVEEVGKTEDHIESNKDPIISSDYTKQIFLRNIFKNKSMHTEMTLNNPGSNLETSHLVNSVSVFKPSGLSRESQSSGSVFSQDGSNMRSIIKPSSLCLNLNEDVAQKYQKPINKQIPGLFIEHTQCKSMEPVNPTFDYNESNKNFNLFGPQKDNSLKHFSASIAPPFYLEDEKTEESENTEFGLIEQNIPVGSIHDNSDNSSNEGSEESIDFCYFASRC